MEVVVSVILFVAVLAMLFSRRANDWNF